MRQRKIIANTEEAKKLKTIIKLVKNNTEINRINIMIIYLWWKNTTETRKILQVSSRTVEETVDRYLHDKDNFYKTNFVWRLLSNEKKELIEEVKNIVIKSTENEENLDINDVLKIINSKHKKEVLNYRQTWNILRNNIKCNYQKPYVKNYKQPENAKEILQSRLHDAIIQIWEKEWIVFTTCDNNKKTRNRSNII